MKIFLLFRNTTLEYKDVVTVLRKIVHDSAKALDLFDVEETASDYPYLISEFSLQDVTRKVTVLRMGVYQKNKSLY